MRIIAVDDEEIALDVLEKAIREASPSAEVAVFDKSADALEYVSENKCEAAFLDINMGSFDGIALAKAMKLEDPELNIIFSTGYDEYALEAIGLRASGYIMKPITAVKVREELDNLRFGLSLSPSEKLRIQCFGNFDVFFGEKPLKFRYTKTKELLAYLVDRNGAMCQNNEIIAVLWEGESEKNGRLSYFKSIRKDLLCELRAVGCGDAVIQCRGAMGINKEAVRCDYYDWLNGTAEGINAYRGEYMMQYSWSEFTHGLIQ